MQQNLQYIGPTQMNRTLGHITLKDRPSILHPVPASDDVLISAIITHGFVHKLSTSSTCANADQLFVLEVERLPAPSPQDKKEEREEKGEGGGI
jgi:hypothetical protein